MEIPIAYRRIHDPKDRLTTWNGKKYILPQGRGTWRLIADRLAAYENCGLEPEELNKSVYSAPEGNPVRGSLTLTLIEEERLAIINALHKAAWHEGDYNDNFTKICGLISKIVNYGEETTNE